MDVLKKLNEVNSYPVYSVYDKEFAAYGRVVEGIDFTAALAYVRDKLPPTDGTEYIASVPEMEKLDCTKALSDLSFGCIDIQMGVCYGYNSALNALEYHKANEVNVSLEGCVILLALLGDLKDGKMDSSAVKAFYLPAGVAVDLYQATLHYAPCKCSDDGFRTIVALPRGTNEALPEGRLNDGGEAAQLTAINKWLLPHESSTDLIKDGVKASITGVNTEVKY